MNLLFLTWIEVSGEPTFNMNQQFLHGNTYETFASQRFQTISNVKQFEFVPEMV